MSRRKPVVRDAIIVAVLLAAVALDCLTAKQTADHPWGALATLSPAALAFSVRRTHPLATLAVLVASYSVTSIFVVGITDLSATALPLPFAGWALGRFADDRALVRGLALFALLIGVVDVLDHRFTLSDVAFPIFAAVAPLAVGRTLRTRALVAVELAERTERLAHEREMRAAEATHDERRRIARELHDVVAHTLSVMVVQAGGARRTLERNPHRAAEALETVEITGRAALDELRRLLGFVGEGSASLEPQPTTGDLPALAARARAAGLPVELVMDGEPRRLPTGAEIAAYRIVQEALTNALKHAGPGARATVALRWSASRLELEIRDTGGTAHVVPQLPESGHGLVGMRERVALYGGTLTAGRLDDGGFAVRARLPVESAGVPA